MGGVISTLGFNQPFLIALLGIIIVLTLTVTLVGGDPPDAAQNEYTYPIVMESGGSPQESKSSDENRQKWIYIQLNTFTNWLNEQLQPFNVRLQDLGADLSDGVSLIHIVEALQNRTCTGKIYRSNPTEIQKLMNVQMALDALREDGVKLVNIGSHDIVEGNLKLILGLIWCLIQRYQIASKTKIPPKKLMMAWMQSVLPELKLTNFRTNWNDGRALSALLDYCQPGLCPEWRSLSPAHSLKNCERAIFLAEKYLGIPAIISPRDLTSPDLDELSCITYLSYFIKKDSPGYVATLHRVQTLLGDTEVNDFSASWSDGFLLANLVEAVGGVVPELPSFQFETLAQCTENVRTGLTAAAELGVGSLVSAEDIADPQNEHLGIMALAAALSSLGATTAVPTTSCYQHQQVNLDLAFADGSEVRVGDLAVSVTGPNGNILRAETIQLRKSRTSKGAVLSLIPTIVGLHQIRILCQGQELPSSPISLQVLSASPVSPRAQSPAVSKSPVQDQQALTFAERRARIEEQFAREEAANAASYSTSREMASRRAAEAQPPQADIGLVSFSGLSEPCSIGSIVEVVINAHGDPSQGAVVVEATAPSSRVHKCQVLQKANSYTATFTPNEVGEWQIGILYDGEHIRGSPFSCQVYDANLVNVYGLDVGLVGQELKFSVNAAQAGEGVVKVSVLRHGRPIPSRIEELGVSKVYRVRFVPDGAGTYNIHVLFNNMEVKGSPFILDIADASSISVYGENLRMASVEKTATFMIHALGTDTKDVNVIITAPSGRKRQARVVPVDDSTAEVQWKPVEAGEHYIDVSILNQSVGESPYVCNVGDPELVTVRAMPRYILTSELFTDHNFEIDASAAGSGNLEIMINGGRVPCRVRELRSRQYLAVFTPTHAVEHVVEMRFNGDRVRGSPWRIPIEEDAGGGILESRESRAVAPRQEARRTTSYYSELTGAGLMRAPVGKNATFDITGDNLDPCDIEAIVYGPDGKEYPVRILTRAQGRYVGEYRIEQVGEHQLTVWIAGRKVEGCPLSVAAYSAERVRIEPLGGGAPGQPVQFVVDAMEAGKGQLEISVNQGRVPNNVQMQGAGRCLVTFIPQHAGTYVIDVTFNGEQVHGCPIRVEILPKQVGQPVAAPIVSHASSTQQATTTTTSTSSTSYAAGVAGGHVARERPTSPTLLRHVRQKSTEPTDLPRSPQLLRRVEPKTIAATTTTTRYESSPGRPAWATSARDTAWSSTSERADYSRSPVEHTYEGPTSTSRSVGGESSKSPEPKKWSEATATFGGLTAPSLVERVKKIETIDPLRDEYAAQGRASPARSQVVGEVGYTVAQYGEPGAPSRSPAVGEPALKYFGDMVKEKSYEARSPLPPSLTERFEERIPADSTRPYASSTFEPSTVTKTVEEHVYSPVYERRPQGDGRPPTPPRDFDLDDTPVGRTVASYREETRDEPLTTELRYRDEPEEHSYGAPSRPGYASYDEPDRGRGVAFSEDTQDFEQRGSRLQGAKSAKWEAPKRDEPTFTRTQSEIIRETAVQEPPVSGLRRSEEVEAINVTSPDFKLKEALEEAEYRGSIPEVTEHSYTASVERPIATARTVVEEEYRIPRAAPEEHTYRATEPSRELPVTSTPRPYGVERDYSSTPAAPREHAYGGAIPADAQPSSSRSVPIVEERHTYSRRTVEDQPFGSLPEEHHLGYQPSHLVEDRSPHVKEHEYRTTRVETLEHTYDMPPSPVPRPSRTVEEREYIVKESRTEIRESQPPASSIPRERTPVAEHTYTSQRPERYEHDYESASAVPGAYAASRPRDADEHAYGTPIKEAKPTPELVQEPIRTSVTRTVTEYTYSSTKPGEPVYALGSQVVKETVVPAEPVREEVPEQNVEQFDYETTSFRPETQDVPVVRNVEEHKYSGPRETRTIRHEENLYDLPPAEPEVPPPPIHDRDVKELDYSAPVTRRREHEYENIGPERVDVLKEDAEADYNAKKEYLDKIGYTPSRPAVEPSFEKDEPVPEDLGRNVVEYATTPKRATVAEAQLAGKEEVQEHAYGEESLQPQAELAQSPQSSTPTTPKTTPKLSLKFKKDKDSKDPKAFEFGKSKFSSRHEVVRRGKEVEVKLENLKLSKEDVLRVLVTPPLRSQQNHTGDQPLEIETKVKKSGSKYEISFKPSDVGTHKVYAYVNEIQHPLCPFPIRVYDSSEIIVGDIPESSALNDTVEFTVDAGRAGFGNLEMAIKDSDGVIIPSHVAQLESGSAKFLVTFTPSTKGPHTVNITFNKEVLKNSPFEVLITEATSAMEVPMTPEMKKKEMKKEKEEKKREEKERSRREKEERDTLRKREKESKKLKKSGKTAVTKIPSLSRVGVPSYLLVSVAGSEPLQVSVTDSKKNPVETEVSEVEPGVQQITFTPTHVGDHEIEVKYGGVDVSGSPFTCRAYDPAKIAVGTIPNGIVDKPVHFVVDASEAGVGNLEVAVNEGRIPSMAHALGQHRYDISFVPRENIDHTISVRFNNEPVPGSPFICRLVSALQVTASGPGLERIPVGNITEFFVQTEDGSKAS